MLPTQQLAPQLLSIGPIQLYKPKCLLLLQQQLLLLLVACNRSSGRGMRPS